MIFFSGKQTAVVDAFLRKIAKCICIHRAVCDTLIAETFDFFQELPDDVGCRQLYRRVSFGCVYEKIAKCLCVRPIFMFAGTKVHDVHSDRASDHCGFFDVHYRVIVRNCLRVRQLTHVY